MDVFWNTGKIFFISSLCFLTLLLAIYFSMVFTVDETIHLSVLWRVGSHSCLSLKPQVKKLNRNWAVRFYGPYCRFQAQQLTCVRVNKKLQSTLRTDFILGILWAVFSCVHERLSVKKLNLILKMAKSSSNFAKLTALIPERVWYFIILASIWSHAINLSTYPVHLMMPCQS